MNENINMNMKIPKRKKESHKGDFGKILIIAGSHGMAGAAILCAKAAISSGSGLVRVAIDSELFNIMQISVPEATCIDRSDYENFNLHEYDAIALGPGLGQYKTNISIIKKILNEYTGKLVLDADGLNCVMKYGLYGNLSKSQAKVVVTPHLGEARRMLEVSAIEDRKIAAFEISETFNTCVVMKGANTIVVDSKIKNTYINNTGNPGMATGGSGDVLTGIIAALLGQGYDVFEASKIGVYVHGLAGDYASDSMGEISMSAMDIIFNLHKAFMTIN